MIFTRRRLRFSAQIAILIVAGITLMSLTGCGRGEPTPSPKETATPATPSPTATPTPGLTPPPVTPAKYSLNISVNPAGSGSVSPSSGSYDSGFQAILQATPAGTCWVFDHWDGDISGKTSPIPITVNGNKNITAYFVKTKYALAVTVIPPQGGTVNPSGGSYDCGTSVTLAAQPAPGYEFDRWQGDVIGNSASASITIDSNKKVSAYFKTSYQTIKRQMPAGSMVLNTVSYSRELKAGDRVQGFVELTGEFQSGDAFFIWTFQMVSPGGGLVQDWQGNVQSTPRHDFDYTAPLEGKYTIKISHVSRWEKNLTIQIEPSGWETG